MIDLVKQEIIEKEGLVKMSPQQQEGQAGLISRLRKISIGMANEEEDAVLNAIEVLMRLEQGITISRVDAETLVKRSKWDHDQRVDKVLVEIGKKIGHWEISNENSTKL